MDMNENTSLMVPLEMTDSISSLPEDTYDDIDSEKEKKESEDMLPDDEMEKDYVEFVTEEILTEDEQEYLFKVLDDDKRLEEILDKVIVSATEFAGSGEVEGPGTGKSDSIPARLSDGEFVFTKKAVDQIGADKLQEMMDEAEREYDNGRESKAMGGNITSNQENLLTTAYNQPENVNYSNVNRYANPDKQQQEDLGRQMMYASKMPSILER